MNAKQEKKYLKGKGLKCPYCDSANLEGDQPDSDGDHIAVNVVCADCDKGWTDIYKLIGVGPK